MPNYGTHTYTTDVQGTLLFPTYVLDKYFVWEVSITIACTSRYRPAHTCGPPEHCDPEEAAEYEFDEFRLRRRFTTILKSTDWSVAEALFGANIWSHLYDDAVTDAEENNIGEEVE